MAYERNSSDNKIKGDSLDSFVQNLSRSYSNQIVIRNAEDELKFNEAVNSDNLTLDDQLTYRKEQLKRVSDDPSERARIRGEIANLKQRKEQQDFTDGYVEKLTAFQSGASSIDSLISYLHEQEGNTTNETVLNTISSKLADAQAQKFKLTQDFISNQTDYATNSKAVDVIDTQIGKVSSYRATALLSGNDQLVSVYDLQLQSLNAAKSQQLVQKDVLNLGAISATGAFSSIALLDAMNAKISGAPTSGPVKVGDTTYASIKDFWTFKRDSFLSDSSSNGFFPSLSGELKDDLNSSASRNSINTSTVSGATMTVASLASRPELANYQKQIDLYKQDVAQTGANLISDKIQNTFAVDLDINKAVTELSSLKTLGVNVDDAYTKILLSNAATKSSQVSGILSAAQNAMANDPSLTPEQAIGQAVAAGAGTVVSPKDAAANTEGKIATDAATTAAAGKGVNDPRTTVNAPAEPANTPQPSGNIPFATIAGLPNLTPGMNSPDVKTLQTFLTQQGFAIPSGATGLYGPETQAAVQAYQEKNKIDTAGNPGFFGPRTKAFISGTQTATTPAPAPTPTVAPVAPAPTVTQPTTTPAPTPSPTPTNTFKKTTSGTYEVYQNGSRVGTGSLDFAKSYGYTGA